MRAHKLRYFEDGNFTGRVGEADIVALESNAAGNDDWCTHIRTPHPLLEDAVNGEPQPGTLSQGDGGLALEIPLTDDTLEPETEAPEPDHTLSDDSDFQEISAQKMQDTIRKAHGLDKGDDDLLPDF